MATLSVCTDIKSLIEYHAAIQVVGKPVRVRGILEYHSNCPFCGGEDRFITRPEEGTYSCATRASGCGRFGDMITFLREYCDMSFREACEEIGVDPSELGDRLLRILFPGAREPHRFLSIQCRPTEDHSGNHYSLDLSSFLGGVPRRQIQVELRRRFCFYRNRRILCLSQMVV